MGISTGPRANNDGLVFYIDLGNTRSYSGSGNIIYDLVSGGIAGTLNNGPTYDVSRAGGLILDGSNDYISFGRRADLQGTNITISTWAKFASLTPAEMKKFGVSSGVKVAEVLPDGRLEMYGLAKGSVITKINDKVINSPKEAVEALEGRKGRIKLEGVDVDGSRFIYVL
jgi:hypothetical protein